MTYSRSAPSPRYTELLEQYKNVHANGIAEQGISSDAAFAGQSLEPHLISIAELCRTTGAKTVLDYGSGKGSRYAMRDLTLPNGETVQSVQAYWGVDAITCFDPAYPAFSTLPEGMFDGVVCTDVLEHVPEQDVDWILAEIFGYARLFVFAVVASYPAKKVLPNGENAHCTVKSAEWWRERVAGAVKASGFSGEMQVTIKEKFTNRSLFDRMLGKPKKIDHVLTRDSLAV